MEEKSYEQEVPSVSEKDKKEIQAVTDVDEDGKLLSSEMTEENSTEEENQSIREDNKIDISTVTKSEVDEDLSNIIVTDENNYQYEILLIVDKDKKEIRAVTGIDEDGKLNTIEPLEENNPQFLKFDKNGGFLDNFLKNYFEQQQNQTHFKLPFFIKLPLIGLDKSLQVLENMIKMPNMEEFISNSKLDTSNFEKIMEKKDEITKEYSPLNESRINWDELSKIGITKEKLEKVGVLEDMLYWKRTKFPINIYIDIAGEKTKAEAILNFKERPNGDIALISTLVRSPRNEYNIDKYIYGTELTPDDRKNLLQSGNVGRLIEVKSGETTKDVFVSLDKITNQLVTVDANKIKIPDEVLGAKLSETQKTELSEGKIVLVEGMQSKKNPEKIFDAMLQINASTRGFDFKFMNEPKNANKQEQENEQHFKKMYNLKGKELDETTSENLSKGQTVYITGMIDDKGQTFNAFVKMNPETYRPKFYSKNPDIVSEVTPDNNSKTQVAVNNDGKTNEATKNVDEPLKQGQQQPTQEQKQEEEIKKTLKIKR